MYDYLSTITPDYGTTALTIRPQISISEESQKNGAIHLGVDGSEERISFNTTSVFNINIQWAALSESDSGLVFDFYNDSNKANGCQRSFKYTLGDGHTYVVRFDCILTRTGNNKIRYGLPGVKLKVLGRIAD